MNKTLLNLLLAFEIMVILAATAFLTFVGVMLFSVTEAIGGFAEAVLKATAP